MFCNIALVFWEIRYCNLTCARRPDCPAPTYKFNHPNRAMYILTHWLISQTNNFCWLFVVFSLFGKCDNLSAHATFPALVIYPRSLTRECTRWDLAHATFTWDAWRHSILLLKRCIDIVHYISYRSRVTTQDTTDWPAPTCKFNLKGISYKSF